MPVPQKRKKPPTFRHYPPDRAKKLKKDWVERAKIKSRWKAQKRREGIVSLRSGKGEEEHDDDKHGSEGSGHPDSNEVSVERPGTASGNSSDESDESSPLTPPPRSPSPRRKPNKQQQQQPHNRSLPHNKRQTGSARNHASTNPRDDKKESVRDLFQKAYSKSSLHTYKADPFKRGRHHHHQNQGRGSFNNARGGGSNVPSRGRGRGQPNMKLRINAMLAKITEQTKAQ